MNILVIEPLGSIGHRNSNTFFLQALKNIGSVTFATFADYQHYFDVESRINIPSSFCNRGSTIAIRIHQIRALSYVLNQTNMDHYDFSFFLCYEEISFAIRWPKQYLTYVFEHNNVDNIRKHRAKAFFFKHIGRNVVHLAYMDYISDFITRNYGREAYKISHPYYVQNLTAGLTDNNNRHLSKIREPIIIFSPSSSNEPSIVEALIDFVSKYEGYHLIAKSEASKTGLRFELKPHFEDYEEQMRNCDLVFFGGRYEYRVSGVVFEALSYGKPAILLNCLFARELKKQYPSSIFPVKDISEIKLLKFNHENIYEEQQRFLCNHSFEKIGYELSEVLDVTKKLKNEYL